MRRDDDYDYDARNNRGGTYYASDRRRGQSVFAGSSSYGGSLSHSGYNALIGLILLYGFGVNVILVNTCAELVASIQPLALIIGYLVLCFTGIAISRKSNNPIISFVGYNLVVVPIGLVLSVALQGISETLVFNALITTAGVVLLMLVASTVYPKVFLSLGRALGITLLIVIIVELILALTGTTTPTFLDVIVALLFCLYIGYDWAKAQDQDFTTDNAVDACVGLYLDIINLFLRILSLYSRHRDD